MYDLISFKRHQLHKVSFITLPPSIHLAGETKTQRSEIITHVITSASERPSQDFSPGLFASMPSWFYCPNVSDKYGFVLTHSGARKEPGLM